MSVSPRSCHPSVHLSSVSPAYQTCSSLLKLDGARALPMHYTNDLIHASLPEHLIVDIWCLHVAPQGVWPVWQNLDIATIPMARRCPSCARPHVHAMANEGAGPGAHGARTWSAEANMSRASDAAGQKQRSVRLGSGKRGPHGTLRPSLPLGLWYHGWRTMAGPNVHVVGSVRLRSFDFCRVLTLCSVNQ
ncbi:hypothetical protein VTO73DRAFT_1682 [Trametes versicolor]